MNSSISGLAAAGMLLCILSVPALSAQATDGIVTISAAKDVTIYTVPPVETPPAPVGEAPLVAPVNITIIICHRDFRRWHYERALGQRYTGFIRMYSGNLYPF